jgi:DNA-binding beta-propeller fold protein YncE
MLARTAPVLLAAVLLTACKDPPSGAGSTGSTDSAAPTGSAAPASVSHEPLRAPERSGGALMRSADGARLYLADEDHKVLRVLPLPFGDEPPEPSPAASGSPSGSPPPAVPSSRPSASASALAKAPPPAAPPPPGSIPANPPPPSARQEETPMPGAPAQVIPLDGYVLVTIRDPGLLLVMKEEPGNKLKEEARIPVAADAWGLALTPDEKVVVVTSAWTHKVTGVDWRARKVVWTLDVMREPRGVVVHPNGITAYVSHLTSGDLTRIDDVAGPSPKAVTVSFPAAPARTPLATTVPGSLGYALVMDESGDRLLAARHALGGLASNAWGGIATVDVLQTRSDRPLLGPRVPGRPIRSVPAFDERRAFLDQHRGSFDSWSIKQFSFPELEVPDLVQPRAMIVAHRSQTVWVASEGDDSVGELPLLAAAPIERPLRVIDVGRQYKDQKLMDSIAAAGGGPTGLALNREETMLYVFCRSTYDVATVRLSRVARDGQHARDTAAAAVTLARVAADTLDESGSRGRRLFYGARDGYSSQGMGCAGCHPEGRDDGHVWHDVPADKKDSHEPHFFASKNLADKTHDGKLGYPLQTPMLAGRVNATGPYGWHAQSPTLLERLAEGFGRHRWSGIAVDARHWLTGERANALVPFLRKGLVPPPRLERELTDEEKKGKEIFESPATKCTTCHDPATGLTDRIAYALGKVDAPPGFEEDENPKYRTPSLLFVGGTPPYFHDGHAPTLEALVSKNADRMGKTSHLSAAERAALVAYLETL